MTVACRGRRLVGETTTPCPRNAKWLVGHNKVPYCQTCAEGFRGNCRRERMSVGPVELYAAEDGGKK